MATWQVDTIARNKAEVATPRARYVVQADRTSFVLQAFKGTRSVERVSLTHKGRAYSLTGVDSAGRTQRQAIRFTGKRVVSRGVFGGRPFSVNGSVCSYIPLLVTQLKGRRPIRLPLITAFVTQFKRDARFRTQVSRRVDMAMMLRAPDAVVIACVIICAECFFTGDPVACVLCDLCLRPDPPT
jgi:hypothetical protein